ncbi:type 12 methyltransferase [Chitinispirillum alkaliphilum]|nr:type 12 methyltransferase [Chitinispirillum alkaliphilum]
MLEVARQRFQGLTNFNFSISDYSKELPSSKFDLIASALSIHHIDDTNKVNLYSGIFDKLNANGCLINLDQFNASSEIMNQYYDESWYEFIDNSKITGAELDSWLKRRELDKENSIDDTKDLLLKIGFKSVECIYSYMKFGVILALK